MASSNVENMNPQTARQVMTEIRSILTNPLEGITLHINDQDITSIEAHIEGPAGTPYADGIFKVKLILGKDFPTSPPKGYFLTKIFHPNIAKNGEICVNTLKKDWKSDLGIKHILLTIKCLLIVPNPESALNEEAGKMLLERYEDYWNRARMMTEIHALVPKNMNETPTETMSTEKPTAAEGPVAKKHAGDKLGEKKKPIPQKDKKRALKRL